MKKILLVFATLLFQFSFSQVSIEGNKLVKNGQSYKFRQYEEVFTHSTAENYFKRARMNKTVGTIIAYTGGAMLGFSAARAIAEPKEKAVSTGWGTYIVEGDRSMWWTYAAVGAGIAAISIPFAIKANKNAEKAVSIENGEATAFKPYFKIENAGAGIALSYNF